MLLITYKGLAWRACLSVTWPRTGASSCQARAITDLNEVDSLRSALACAMQGAARSVSSTTWIEALDSDCSHVGEALQTAASADHQGCSRAAIGLATKVWYGPAPGYRRSVRPCQSSSACDHPRSPAGISGHVEIAEGKGGLPKVTLTHASGSRAEVTDS